MPKNNEQMPPHWTTIAKYPWVQGPILGASMMYSLTPLLNLTNQILNNKKITLTDIPLWTRYALHNPGMALRTVWAGGVSYALSVVPSYAATFAAKAVLKKTPESTFKLYDLFTSFVAGASAGFLCTPFEAFSQNKQLAKGEPSKPLKAVSTSISSKEVINLMVKHHGYFSFFQGAASLMGREGCWSTVYLTAIPMVSHHLQEKGMKKNQADFVAVVAVAGMFGFLSTPLNIARFRKQDGLTRATPTKSYLAHAQDIWEQEPSLSRRARVGSFFKGGLPRTLTTMVAGGLMVKGTEIYNQTINAFRG